MAIDRIGGMGSASTYASSQAQEISVKSVGGADSNYKADVALPGAKDSSGKQMGNDQDKAAVISDKEISPEKVKAAVEDLNKQVKMRHTQCSFKYHDDTNRISITVMDSETQEVIKEIPPEKALDMLAKAWELAGLMVDEKR